MLENLSLATFTALLNTDFRIFRNSDEPAVVVKLAKAVDLGSTSRQEQFSILFCGLPEQPLGQGLYRLDHDRLGSFDLFIVPVGRDAQGYQYEAIFNRLR